MSACAQELAPDAAPGAVAWQLPASVKPSARVKKASNATVRAQADFRNQTFLNTFISELGKLPPKRTTRLQQKDPPPPLQADQGAPPDHMCVAELPVPAWAIAPAEWGALIGTEAESLSCVDHAAR